MTKLQGTWASYAKEAAADVRRAARAAFDAYPYAQPHVGRRLEQIGKELDDVLESPATAERL